MYNNIKMKTKVFRIINKIQQISTAVINRMTLFVLTSLANLVSLCAIFS